MSTSSIRIAAKPADVYRLLTQPMDDIEPGPLKVGDMFAEPGKNEVFTITAVDPPRSFGFSVMVGDVTTKANYSIAADGDGSLVSVEMDQESPSNPLMVMLYGFVMEGRNERGILDELKTRVEQSVGPAQPAAAPASAAGAAPPAASEPGTASGSTPTPAGTAEAAAERRPCPRCGESIPTVAAVCRFCGHELSGATSA